MKRTRLKSVGLILCVMMMLMASGCGASMFTSEHKHYHGTKEIDEKIHQLEQRIEHLEAMHPH